MAEGWIRFGAGPRAFWSYAGFPAPHAFFEAPARPEWPEDLPFGTDVKSSLATVYGAPPPSCAHVKQVHGDVCLEVTLGGPLPAPPEEADALATASSACVLRVKTADCVPVLLSVASGKAAAAAHAGWRGAVRGVLAQTVRKLQALAPDEADAVHALIGPCIRFVHYEVKQDFIDEAAAFIDPAPYLRPPPHGSASSGLCFDLPALARDQLRQAGVSRVIDCGLDTYPSDSGFLSRRRSFHEGRKYEAHNDSLIWPAPAGAFSVSA